MPIVFREGISNSASETDSDTSDDTVPPHDNSEMSGQSNSTMPAREDQCHAEQQEDPQQMEFTTTPVESHAHGILVLQGMECQSVL